MSGQPIRIQGRVCDSRNKQGIEYVNVALLNKDSLLLYGTVTDSVGHFFFDLKEKLPASKLYISMMGYNSLCLPLKPITSSQWEGDAGPIFLTESSVQLSDISVQASRMVHKAGTQVALPTLMQKNKSSNGFDLLDRMMFSQLNVDRRKKTVSVPGKGDVQFRINSIKATAEEVFSIKPENVVRIEYIDMPGVKYGDEEIGAVINYVVKRLESGGYISVNANNTITQVAGTNSLVGRVNYKKSEFGISYVFDYDKVRKRKDDEDIHFIYPSHTIQRISTGVYSPFSTIKHTVNLSYNLVSDRYLFNIIARQNILTLKKQPQSFTQYNQNAYSSSSVSTYLKNNPETTALDLYYKYNLPKKQNLSLNVVGTHIGTNRLSRYNESVDEEIATRILNNVSGHKYSVIAEGLYEKATSFSTLNIGLRHVQGYARNSYSGDHTSKESLANSSTYFFIQLQGNIQKINYIAGLGGMRFYYKNNNKSFEYYMIRPDLKVEYKYKNFLSFHYNFSIRPSIPSLAFLNDVPQSQDAFQTAIGNPALKPYNEYENEINVNFSHAAVDANVRFYHHYYSNPIMESNSLVNDQIILSSLNQKRFVNYGLNSDISFRIYKEYLILKLIGNIAKNRSEGENYTHHLTSIYGKLQLFFAYKNWGGMFSMHTRQQSLWGETFIKGAKYQVVEVNYNLPFIKLALGMDLPFGKEWNKRTEVASSVNPSVSWMRMKVNRAVYLNIQWNFSIGRKYKTVNKNLKNIDRDSGIF